MLAPSQIDAPVSAVRFRDARPGTNGRLVILIEDAHANYDGQKNIASAIRSLTQAYGIRTVLLEGGDRRANLDALAPLVPPRDLKIGADKLLRQGVLSGPEHLSLTEQTPADFIGIENGPHYRAALLAYARVAELRPAAERDLRQALAALDAFKDRLYPETLRRYESEAKAATPGSDPGSLKRLQELAEKAGVKLDGYPALRELKKLQAAEKRVDFGSIHREQEMLMSQLRAGDAAEESAVLADRIGRTSQPAELQNLIGRLLGLAAHPERYPHLSRYAEYLDSFKDLDWDAVLTEAEVLEAQCYRELLPDPDARRIAVLGIYLKLVQKAHDLRLSSREFALLRSNRKDFAAEAWTGFLKEMASALGIRDLRLPEKPSFDRAWPAVRAFYSLVNLRDRAFAANARRALDQTGDNAAILVAGGYHTEHLKELMTREGYGWAVLSPQIRTETDRDAYEKILLTPLRLSIRTSAAAVADNHISKALLAGNRLSKGLDPLIGAVWSDPSLLMGLDRLRQGARLAEEERFTIHSYRETIEKKTDRRNDGIWDRGQLLRLLTDALARLGAKDMTPEMALESWSGHDILTLIDALILSDRGRPVGLYSYFYFMPLGTGQAYANGIYLYPEYRGMGLGTALMKRLLDRLRFFGTRFMNIGRSAMYPHISIDASPEAQGIQEKFIGQNPQSVRHILRDTSGRLLGYQIDLEAYRRTRSDGARLAGRGGEKARKNALIAELGRESGVIERMQLADALGLDLRPIDAGLLDAVYVGHAMAMKRVVNPDDRPLVALNGGSGADASSLLLSTNARRSYFVDQTKVKADDLRAALSKWNQLGDLTREYRRQKFLFGHAVSSPAGLISPAQKFLGELQAIGVRKDSIRIHSDSGAATVTFRWAYPGLREKRYSITLIQANVVESELYPDVLKKALARKIDIYYQRAPWDMASWYPRFLPELAASVREGGFLMTDDTNYDGSVYESRSFQAPLQDLGFASERSFSDELRRYTEAGFKARRNIFQAHHRTDDELHYGFDLALRQRRSAGARLASVGRDDGFKPGDFVKLGPDSPTGLILSRQASAGSPPVYTVRWRRDGRFEQRVRADQNGLVAIPAKEALREWASVSPTALDEQARKPGEAFTETLSRQHRRLRRYLADSRDRHGPPLKRYELFIHFATDGEARFLNRVLKTQNETIDLYTRLFPGETPEFVTALALADWYRSQIARKERGHRSMSRFGFARVLLAKLYKRRHHFVAGSRRPDNMPSDVRRIVHWVFSDGRSILAGPVRKTEFVRFRRMAGLENAHDALSDERIASMQKDAELMLRMYSFDLALKTLAAITERQGTLPPLPVRTPVPPVDPQIVIKNLSVRTLEILGRRLQTADTRQITLSGPQFPYWQAYLKMGVGPEVIAQALDLARRDKAIVSHISIKKKQIHIRMLGPHKKSKSELIKIQKRLEAGVPELEKLPPVLPAAPAIKAKDLALSEAVARLTGQNTAAMPTIEDLSLVLRKKAYRTVEPLGRIDRGRVFLFTVDPATSFMVNVTPQSMSVDAVDPDRPGELRRLNTYQPEGIKAVYNRTLKKLEDSVREARRADGARLADVSNEEVKTTLMGRLKSAFTTAIAFVTRHRDGSRHGVPDFSGQEGDSILNETSVKHPSIRRAFWQGRTYLIEEEPGGEYLIGYKFANGDDPGGKKLISQYQNMLAARRIGIPDAPEPLAEVGKLNDIIGKYPTNLNPEHVLKFRAKKTSRQYLTRRYTDIDPALRGKALDEFSGKAVRDLSLGMLHGRIHTSLTPLTHSEAFGEKWFWNVDPIGEVQNLQESMRYVNLRRSGIDDYEHFDAVNENTNLDFAMGQEMVEWLIAVAYAGFINGLTRAQIENILMNGYGIFYALTGIGTDPEPLRPVLRQFLKKFQTEWQGDRLEVPSATRSDTSLKHLVDLTESLLQALRSSSAYGAVKERWLKAPDGYRSDELISDPAGRLIRKSWRDGTIKVLGSDLRVLREIRAEESPEAVTAGTDGRIWTVSVGGLTAYDAALRKTGGIIGRFHPSIESDPGNRIVLADVASGDVLVYGPDLDLIQRISNPFLGGIQTVPVWALNDEGRLAVRTSNSDSADHSMAIYDIVTGRKLHQMQADLPIDVIAADREGNWITGGGGRIAIYDPELKKTRLLSLMNSVTAINVDPNGLILVGDEHSNRVLVFDPELKLKSEIRSYGYNHRLILYDDAFSYQGEVSGLRNPYRIVESGAYGLFVIEKTKNLALIRRMPAVGARLAQGLNYFVRLRETIAADPERGIAEYAKFVVTQTRSGLSDYLELLRGLDRLAGSDHAVRNSEAIERMRAGLEVKEDVRSEASLKSVSGFLKDFSNTSIYDQPLRQIQLQPELLASDEVQSVLVQISALRRWMWRLSEHLEILLKDTSGSYSGIIDPSIDAGRLLEEAIERERGRHPEHHRPVEIETDFENGLPSMTGDRVRLLNAFRELIRNAVFASIVREGRSYFSYRSRSRILVKAQFMAETQHVRVTIEDNGVGMKPEDIPDIFKFAYSRDRSEQGVYFGGRGIGMPTAVETIAEHRGLLQIDSDPSWGTRLEIDLPVDFAAGARLAGTGGSEGFEQLLRDSEIERERLFRRLGKEAPHAAKVEITPEMVAAVQPVEVARQILPRLITAFRRSHPEADRVSGPAFLIAGFAMPVLAASVWLHPMFAVTALPLVRAIKEVKRRAELKAMLQVLEEMRVELESSEPGDPDAAESIADLAEWAFVLLNSSSAQLRAVAHQSLYAIAQIAGEVKPIFDQRVRELNEWHRLWMPHARSVYFDPSLALDPTLMGGRPGRSESPSVYQLSPAARSGARLAQSGWKRILPDWLKRRATDVAPMRVVPAAPLHDLTEAEADRLAREVLKKIVPDYGDPESQFEPVHVMTFGPGRTVPIVLSREGFRVPGHSHLAPYAHVIRVGPLIFVNLTEGFSGNGRDSLAVRREMDRLIRLLGDVYEKHSGNILLIHPSSFAAMEMKKYPGMSMSMFTAVMIGQLLDDWRQGRLPEGWWLDVGSGEDAVLSRILMRMNRKAVLVEKEERGLEVSRAYLWKESWNAPGRGVNPDYLELPGDVTAEEFDGKLETAMHVIGAPLTGIVADMGPWQIYGPIDRLDQRPDDHPDAAISRIASNHPQVRRVIHGGYTTDPGFVDEWAHRIAMQQNRTRYQHSGFQVDQRDPFAGAEAKNREFLRVLTAERPAESPLEGARLANQGQAGAGIVDVRAELIRAAVSAADPDYDWRSEASARASNLLESVLSDEGRQLLLLNLDRLKLKSARDGSTDAVRLLMTSAMYLLERGGSADPEEMAAVGRLVDRYNSDVQSGRWYESAGPLSLPLLLVLNLSYFVDANDKRLIEGYQRLSRNLVLLPGDAGLEAVATDLLFGAAHLNHKRDFFDIHMYMPSLRRALEAQTNNPALRGRLHQAIGRFLAAVQPAGLLRGRLIWLEDRQYYKDRKDAWKPGYEWFADRADRLIQILTEQEGMLRNAPSNRMPNAWRLGLLFTVEAAALANPHLSASLDRVLMDPDAHPEDFDRLLQELQKHDARFGDRSDKSIKNWIHRFRPSAVKPVQKAILDLRALQESKSGARLAGWPDSFMQFFGLSGWKPVAGALAYASEAEGERALSQLSDLLKGAEAGSERRVLVRLERGVLAIDPARRFEQSEVLAAAAARLAVRGIYLELSQVENFTGRVPAPDAADYSEAVIALNAADLKPGAVGFVSDPNPDVIRAVLAGARLARWEGGAASLAADPICTSVLSTLFGVELPVAILAKVQRVPQEAAEREVLNLHKLRPMRRAWEVFQQILTAIRLAAISA